MNIIFITKRILLQFIRDKRTIGLIFIIPILIMTIFFFLFKDNLSTNLKIGVYLPNRDSKISKGIIETLDEKTEISYILLEDDNLEEGIVEKNLDVAIGFEENLDEDIKENNNAKCKIVYEGTKPDIQTPVNNLVKLVVMNGFRKSKSTFVKFLGTDVNIETEEAYKYTSKDFKFIDLISPAFIVFFVYFISFLLTCVAFLRERSYGTLERVFVSPIKSFQVIFGYLIAFFIITLIQSLLLLVFSIYVLAIKTSVNIFLALIPMSITALLGVAMGMFFSTLAKNEFQVVQFVPVVIVPQALLSGILFEVSAIPDWLRPLSYAMPLTYTNIILKDVLLRGKNLIFLWQEFLILFGFFVLFFFLSLISIRNQK